MNTSTNMEGMSDSSHRTPTVYSLNQTRSSYYHNEIATDQGGMDRNPFVESIDADSEA